MSAASHLQARPVTTGPDGQPRWTVRRTRWFLVGLHLPFVAVPTLITIAASEDPRGSPLLVVPLVLAIGGLQLRHSFAAARGRRPRHWPWTLLALAVLVYVPMLWLSWRWYTAMWFVIGSAAMLLPRRLAALVIAAQPGIAIFLHHPPWAWEELHPATLTWIVVYLSAILLMGGACLYAAARLVCVIDELYDARAELAQVAVDRERLRISRDLHDLLGSSLSAVSLKGDLALRLLSSDPQAARSEIASLTQMARNALRDVRGVTRGQPRASYQAEIDGAATLLAAAGIDARIDADLPELSPPVDDVLGWAVREGVTNILRHSEAATCSITARREAGRIRLEIVNDGAPPSAGQGTGLGGLAERARALSGSVSARRTRDGHFQLQVEVPQEAAA
ncbi:MAG TPA: histidine kinase [Actinomycetes bacterium]|nr:histidine kinase [Actinomycetes bacterium]